MRALVPRPNAAGVHMHEAKQDLGREKPRAVLQARVAGTSTHPCWVGRGACTRRPAPSRPDPHVPVKDGVSGRLL